MLIYNYVKLNFEPNKLKSQACNLARYETIYFSHPLYFMHLIDFISDISFILSVTEKKENCSKIERGGLAGIINDFVRLYLSTYREDGQSKRLEAMCLQDCFVFVKRM